MNPETLTTTVSTAHAAGVRRPSILARADRSARRAVVRTLWRARALRHAFGGGLRRLAYEARAALRPRRDWTDLGLAAAAGDTATVERLLAAGVDPSARDRAGLTAMHHAIARGHAETAAVLLARGADPDAPDGKGRPALGLRYATLEMLHAVRQRYHRLPHRDSPPAAPGPARDWASELDANGIVRVSNLIPDDELVRMREEFETFVVALESRLARGEGLYRHYDEEEHFWPDDLAYVTNNAFKYSRALARFCLHPWLIEAARLYLGKPAFIQRAMGFRYLPTGRAPDTQFRWHHDMQEQRFKVMVLLTDVGESDQYMTYAMGSHKLFHPYAMFLSNACDLDYVRRHLPGTAIYRATGRAGDVFLFDTNGAHRGNRSETARVRDVYLVEFSGDRSYSFGGDVDSTVAGAVAPGTNPFARLAAAEKRWTLPRRRGGSWAESLVRVESWR